MRAITRLAGKLAGLPKPTHRPVVERDLPMTTSDGVTLLADRHHHGDHPMPVVLMRSPYGRGGIGAIEVALLAERGCQVVIQSCRGTSGSGGEFDPVRREKQDGAECIEWVKSQPWCDGRVMTYGASYVGITQWAALAAGADVDAMAVHVADSHPPTSMNYVGGAFALETQALWIRGQDLDAPKSRRDKIKDAFTSGAFRRTVATTPIVRELDEIVRGMHIPFFQAWLDHPDTDDPWWEPSDFRDGLDRAPQAISSVAGWYDLFLAGQIRDVESLQARGIAPRLRIGPWTHFLMPKHKVLDALRLYDDTFGGRPGAAPRAPDDERPVQLRLCRDDEWLGFESWPPRSDPQVWHLRAGGNLLREAPRAEAPDRYTWDPHDPTPIVGGTHLSPKAGARDQAPREERDDVLVYTTPPFSATTRIAGDLEATLHVTTSLAHADLFVRLCHVDRKGTSTNLADGILRMSPDNGLGRADEARAVTVRMFPVGVLVEAGERLRVQVSSGAHPAYVRNWGVPGDQAATADGPPCDVTVHHDADRPSSITLPVLDPRVV